MNKKSIMKLIILFKCVLYFKNKIKGISRRGCSNKIMLDHKVNHLVTKSNVLIEANYKLGTVEQKIILYLASKIQPTDLEFHTYQFSIKEFNEMIGLSGSPKYSELRQITSDLMKKVFTVRIGDEITQVSWLSSVTYKEKEGVIQLRFDPFLKSYLLQLKRNFTSYRIENVVKLKSSYSIRIYELLKQYEKIKERTFTLDELRGFLGAEDIYPGYGNFKQRILKTAEKELKNKTDLCFKIQEIKRGRKVSAIKFEITSKKREVTNESAPLLEKPLNFFNKSIDIFTKEKGIVVEDETLKQWKDFGEEKVLSLIDQIKMRSDIKNPIAYINTIISKQKIRGNEKILNEEYMIFNKIREKYKYSLEPIVDWVIQEEVYKFFKDEGYTIEQCEEVWNKNGEQLIRDIRKIVKKNRNKIIKP